MSFKRAVYIFDFRNPSWTGCSDVILEVKEWMQILFVPLLLSYKVCGLQKCIVKQIWNEWFKYIPEQTQQQTSKDQSHYGHRRQPTLTFPRPNSVCERRQRPWPYHLQEENSYKLLHVYQVIPLPCSSPNAHNDPCQTITKANTHRQTETENKYFWMSNF